MTVPAVLLLGPYIGYALIITVPLFLWELRRWNQPRWTALAITLVATGLAVLLAHRTPYEAGLTVLIAFTVGGYASFTFADTVNDIGQSRYVVHDGAISAQAQERGYRRRALNVHTLHYAQNKHARSLVLADIQRPPGGREEWMLAHDIARALNEPTVRKLRDSWDALVATGRPLALIAAVIGQTNKQEAVRFLTSDMPDEYLAATIAKAV